MPKGVYTRNPLLRPQTFKTCEQCKCRFGPVSHLNRKFCSLACKVNSQKTGITKVRVGTKEAKRATRTVAYHIGTGKLKKPKCCEQCGQERKIEGAHYDYSRPLDVRWLCIPCHRKWDHEEPKHGTVSVEIEKLTGRKAELAK